MQQYDVIVIGAGLSGAVAARQFAEAGNRVLVLERRNHIAGNAYDDTDEASIRVHRYGPHIFHTKDEEAFVYLSKFTQWRDYQHRVVADIHGVKIPVPFNFRSLDSTFGNQSKLFQQKLIHAFGEREKVSILELRESMDEDLAEIGEYVYNNIFLHYSKKQWGNHFDELDPSTFQRVPVLLSYEDHYFQDQWQCIPVDGYTQMVHNILNHSAIEMRLNTGSEMLLTLSDEGIFFEGKPYAGNIIYTGSIDELFGCCYGRLPYRTLDFCFETHPVEWYQEYGVINYTVDQDYTRITEYKHLTGQKRRSHTTIVKEYPREFAAEQGEIPYYPIPSDQSNRLYQRYAKLAQKYTNLYLLGRLAEYKYYDMDLVVSNALKLFKRVERVKQ